MLQSAVPDAGRPSSIERGREFLLTDSDFEKIRAIVGEQTGIALTDKKRELVYSRLAKRLRHLGLTSFSQYCALIERGDAVPLTDLQRTLMPLDELLRVTLRRIFCGRWILALDRAVCVSGRRAAQPERSPTRSP